MSSSDKRILIASAIGSSNSDENLGKSTGKTLTKTLSTGPHEEALVTTAFNLSRESRRVWAMFPVSER